MGKESSDPPDYTPMANASAESARIMGELGQRQLDFAKQQYEEAKPVIDALVRQQMSVSDKSAAQGDDYYAYLKSFRPIEQAMMDESMRDRASEIAAYDAANKADATTISADDAALYGANRGAIDARIGTAVADTQGAYNRAIDQAIRHGLRYGGSTAGIVDAAGALSLGQASNIAAAANEARRAGIQDARERAMAGLQLRQNNMGALNRERAIDWAKKLDAAGLVKGLPGASSGAYGLATSAADSAARNTMLPGAQKLQGMATGANTIGQGRQLYQSGLGSILNAQTSVYNADRDDGGLWGALGTLGGTAMAVYKPKLPFFGG